MATMRECGPDCTAFAEESLDDPRMTTCKVLNAIRSTALSFAHIARTATAWMETVQQAGKKKIAQDLKAVIDSIPLPPKVNQ
jgi:hypothetical protein